MLGHNPHIVHCFAKIAKSLEIKEEVTTNQRKTYVKRIKLIRFRILLILRVKSILRYYSLDTSRYSTRLLAMPVPIG